LDHVPDQKFQKCQPTYLHQQCPQTHYLFEGERELLLLMMMMMMMMMMMVLQLLLLMEFHTLEAVY
jgi:hypothetical protein